MHLDFNRLTTCLFAALSSVFLAEGVCARAQAIPRPVIPAAVFNITNYGAVGDGRTVNTRSIQKTVEACSAAGGGTVLVPAGQFVFGPIRLASRINLRLDHGAVLLLDDDRGNYPISAKRYQDGITVADAEDIEISGEGVIDGQGKAWWAAFIADLKAGRQTMAHRPYLTKISHCTRVRVSGITLRNSPMFHLVTQDCTDVTIQNITIQAPSNAANTDGLDPSGWNYLITGCFIDTGDDNIAIKPGRGRTPADKNFMVSDCTFGHGHGMSIGGGSLNGLEDLTVSNCTFTGTDSGIRIKTGRGNGGLLRHLTYENLTMTRVRNPIYINDYYPERNAPKDPATETAEAAGPRTPFCEDVVIRNVMATNCQTAGTIRGLPEAPISGLLLTNVSLSAETGMKIHDVRAMRFAASKIRVQTGEPATTFNAQIEGLEAAEALPREGKEE
jgi:polygalacturonase